jgi:hypothetical protein
VKVRNPAGRDALSIDAFVKTNTSGMTLGRAVL